MSESQQGPEICDVISRKRYWKYLQSQNASWNDFRAPSAQALPHPSRAPVLSFAHYFQAPATQAIQEKKNTPKNLREGWCPPPAPISFLVRPRVKLTLINLGGAQCLVAINIAINTDNCKVATS